MLPDLCRGSSGTKVVQGCCFLDNSKIFNLIIVYEFWPNPFETDVIFVKNRGSPSLRVNVSLHLMTCRCPGQKRTRLNVFAHWL